MIFIIWVISIIVQVSVIRGNVESKVGVISDLNEVGQHLEGDASSDQKSEVMESIRASSEFVSDSLLVQLKTVYLGQKASDYNSLTDAIRAEIRDLRIQLRNDSQRLGELWGQVTASGLIACIFALMTSLLFLSNLARRRKLEQANEDLNILNRKLDIKSRELEEINDTKDQLFMVIGHDLRSPINSLKGLLDLVDHEAISADEFLQFSAKVRNGVEHLHFSLNNLLVWANAQMQGIKTEKKSVALRQLSDWVLQLSEDQSKKKGIEVVNDIDDSIRVMVDEDQLKLILRNLLSNAFKFTSSGGRVRLNAVTGGDTCEIHIEDTGIGMSDTARLALFKKRSTESRFGTDGEKGTGLGLMLTQEFVAKNGGKIWVESEEGRGTKFFFTLDLSN